MECDLFIIFWTKMGVFTGVHLFSPPATSFNDIKVPNQLGRYSSSTLLASAEHPFRSKWHDVIEVEGVPSPDLELLMSASHLHMRVNSSVHRTRLQYLITSSVEPSVLAEPQWSATRCTRVSAKESTFTSLYFLGFVILLL